MAESNTDIRVTLDAFAKIVIEKWRARMNLAGVGTRGGRELFNSFRYSVSPGRIEFQFNGYGHYVDKGVGKEIRKGNSGNLGFTPGRKQKKWYYSIFMNQSLALQNIMAKKFGISASVYVTENWSAPRLTISERGYDVNGNSTRINPLFEARRQELEMMRNLAG